jgi:hypothetical protein
MHLFPPLPIPFCFLSHLTVAPSSLYHRRFLTFLFVLYKPSAYWIRLSLFQGNPSHSFLLLTVSSFIATLFSRTPFGTYSTRLELILEKSTIHSFCSSGQPEFYTTKNKNPTNSRHRSARKIFSIYISLPTIRLLFIPTASACYLAPPARVERSTQEFTQTLRKYAGRRADTR